MPNVPLQNAAIQRDADGSLRIIPRTKEDRALVDALIDELADSEGQMLANVTVAGTVERLREQARATHGEGERLKFKAKDAERAGRGGLPSVKQDREEAERMFARSRNLLLDQADADRWTGERLAESARSTVEREPERFIADYDRRFDNEIVADIPAGDDRRLVVAKRSPLINESADDLTYHDIYVVAFGQPPRAWNLSIDIDYDSGKPPALDVLEKALDLAKDRPDDHMAAIEKVPYGIAGSRMECVVDHVVQKHGRGEPILERGDQHGLSR